MSLVLRFSTSDSGDGTFFRFFDTTGVFNTSYNPGGFGSPNVQISDIDWAEVAIRRIGDTTNTVYTINVFPDMPSSDTDFFITILNTQIGLTSSQKIISAQYEITYSIGHFDSICTKILDATTTHVVAIIPVLKCCIKKVRQGLPVPSKGEKCCCENKDVTGLCNAQQIMDSICELVKCEQFERATEMINYMNIWCACNCASCT